MGASQSARPANILLLGLDGAGKSSMIARLTGDEVRTVLPTLGFSLRTFTLGSNSLQLKLWDLGGSASVRHYWPAYYAKASAIAFVIDTTDRHRLAENSLVLQHLLDDDDLIGLPLLVLANKQDAAEAIPASEIEELMHLSAIRDRLWHCTSCSALRGTGIVDGLHWLARAHAQLHGSPRAKRARTRLRRRTPGALIFRRRARPDVDEDSAPIVQRDPVNTGRGRRTRRNPVPTPATRTEDDPGSDDESAGIGGR